MILISIVIGIALLSLTLGYLSVKKDMQKQQKIGHEVKKQLEKGRVIFYSKKA